MLATIVGVGTTILGYFVGKKQANATVRKTEAEAVINEVKAVETAATLWRELAQDLKKEAQLLKAEIVELRQLVSELKSENISV